MVYCYIGNDKRIEEFTMPLTHVCMWSKHGWDPVTAEKAAHMHPGGTVAARSGLFMCSLCGQYVTLTDIPEQSVKMANAVLATGPIVLLYPFVQKYFIGGITVGAVKG